MASIKVTSIRFQTPDLFELRLERAHIQFQPGDCLALATPTGESRPYSLASGTNDDCLRFYIRRLNAGTVSAWLSSLQPGQTVDATPPFGWFRPAQPTASAEPCVYVATGTGIAPFVSALRSVPNCCPVSVLYGVRQLADALALEYLTARAPLTLAVSREAASPHHHGRVTDLLPTLPLAPHTHYYLCGLDVMVNEVNAWLATRGVPHTHIHREIFFNA